MSSEYSATYSWQASRLDRAATLAPTPPTSDPRTYDREMNRGAGATPILSWRSKRSVLSYRSVLSIASSGSILSVASTGSILSIGSAGSILSIGSAGSILSIGSAGSILSIRSAGSILAKDAAGRIGRGSGQAKESGSSSTSIEMP